MTPAAAAAAQLDHSLVAHLLQIPGKRLLRVAEVAALLDYSMSLIYNLLEEGELEAHYRLPKSQQKGLFGEVLDAKGKLSEVELRRCTRITRRSVVSYLARSARYDLTAEEIISVIGNLLPHLPNRGLEVTRAKCAQILATRSLHQ